MNKLFWLWLAAMAALFAFAMACDANGAEMPFDQSFIAYIKQAEGLRLTPYYLNGVPHIGYGHRIKEGEAFGVISEAQAERMLQSDLRSSYEAVCRQIGYAPTGAAAEMLTDFQFNLGSLRQFPKMVKAVKENDIDGIKRECIRYANHKELKQRNKMFIERFLCGR